MTYKAVVKFHYKAIIRYAVILSIYKIANK